MNNKKGWGFMFNPIVLGIVIIIGVAYAVYAFNIYNDLGLLSFNPGHLQYSVLTDLRDPVVHIGEDAELKTLINFFSGPYEDLWIRGEYYVFVDEKFTGISNTWSFRINSDTTNYVIYDSIESIDTSELQPGNHTVSVRMVAGYNEDDYKRWTLEEYYDSCISQIDPIIRQDDKWEYLNQMYECDYIRYSEIEETTLYVSEIDEEPECKIDDHCGEGYICNAEDVCELIPENPGFFKRLWQSISTFLRGLI